MNLERAAAPELPAERNVESNAERNVESNAELLAILASRRDEFIDFLRRRTRSDGEPEDLLQQALLAATRKIGQLREPDLVVAWFYKILRRVLADDHARSAARRDKLSILEAEVNAGTRSHAREVPTCACSLGIIGSLRPQYAEILRRIDVAEEDLAAVAASLGTTTNNATVRLHRARRALRERLLSLCGTTSVSSCLDCGCDGGPASKPSS